MTHTIRPIAATLFAVFALAASGCVMAPSEVQDMRRDIAETRIEVQKITTEVQDIKRRMDYSLGQIDTKMGLQKDTLGAATGDLQDQLTRIERRLGAAPSTGSASIASTDNPPPSLSDTQSEALLGGHEAYSRGEYDEAIKQYSQFLQQYPDSDRAPEAAFCLSRSWYQKSDFEKACQGFDRLAQQYPADEIVPKALHSKALCEIRLNRLGDARATLQTLMQQRPDYETDRIKALYERVESSAIPKP